MDVFARTSLEAHNKFRSAHNVPPLSWSNELARGAQIWANKLAKEGRLKHDRLEGIGENVFMASQGFDTAAEQATKTWYSEVNYIWVAECCILSEAITRKQVYLNWHSQRKRIGNEGESEGGRG